jgi:tungstate transport system ATP-binding protein
VFPIRLFDVCWDVPGRRVLDRIDLRIDAGGITAIVGPNGAGKTALLRLLHGLTRPSAGEISFAGVPPLIAPHSDLAYPGQALVFQYNPMLRDSVLANVVIALEAEGLSRAERHARARRALARVGLADRAADPARKLSGGERQRLAIARAWLTQPRLMLMDEPTANLDPSATEQVEGIVRDIAASGCKVMLVSHNLGQVRRIADQVVFIAGGRVCETAPADEFFRAPSSDEARRFIQGELPWHFSVAHS